MRSAWRNFKAESSTSTGDKALPELLMGQLFEMLMGQLVERRQMPVGSICREKAVACWVNLSREGSCLLGQLVERRQLPVRSTC